MAVQIQSYAVKQFQPHLCNLELRDQAAIETTLTGTCEVIQVNFNT